MLARSLAPCSSHPRPGAAPAHRPRGVQAQLILTLTLTLTLTPTPGPAPLLFIAPEECKHHFTAPHPIARSDECNPPPENVNRLHVLTQPGELTAAPSQQGRLHHRQKRVQLVLQPCAASVHPRNDPPHLQPLQLCNSCHACNPCLRRRRRRLPAPAQNFVKQGRTATSFLSPPAPPPGTAAGIGILHTRAFAHARWETRGVASAAISDVIRCHEWSYVRDLMATCSAIPVCVYVVCVCVLYAHTCVDPGPSR